jgi:hypothetical protein
VTAARASGVGKAVGDYSLPQADNDGAMETCLVTASRKRRSRSSFP